jgi:PAS domain S-box-containing protein
MAERRKTTLAGWFSKLFRATPEGASAAPISTPSAPPPIIDLFFNATADGLIIVNLSDGLVIRANLAAERLLGYISGGLEGVHFSALLPPSTASEHTTVQHRFRGMVGVSEGQAFCRQDGTEIPCDLLMTLLPDFQHPTAVLNLRDASEREARTAKQEDAVRSHAESEALKEATRQKDQFISLLAHQLRTPLAVIHSAAGMVLRYYERLTVEKRLDHLHRIQTHSRLASAFIEDLRFLNRADSREITLQLDICDVAELLGRAIKPYHDHLNQPHIILAVPETPVMAQLDELLFIRMVDKLISNAVLYSPQASTLHITLTQEADKLHLTIVDKGIGIPPDFLTEAFVPYRRGNNVGEVDGVGLGLTVAQACIKLLGGELSLNSAIGEGTTVHVQLSSP